MIINRMIGEFSHWIFGTFQFISINWNISICSIIANMLCSKNIIQRTMHLYCRIINDKNYWSFSMKPNVDFYATIDKYAKSAKQKTFLYHIKCRPTWEASYFHSETIWVYWLRIGWHKVAPQFNTMNGKIQQASRDVIFYVEERNHVWYTIKYLLSVPENYRFCCVVTLINSQTFLKLIL